MGTSIEKVIDLALVTIQDYKIDKLYQDKGAFNNYMLGFLERAIPLFSNCNKDLSYNEEDFCFNEELSNEEINILAYLIGIIWLEREINNITQISLRIGQGTDAKTYSESQNLNAKRERLIQMEEKCDHLMNVYGYKGFFKGGFF